MSELRNRISALQQQAGTRLNPTRELLQPSTTNLPNTPHLPETLARWLQQRQRLQSQSMSPAASDMGNYQAVQMPLPGREIAAGVRLQEQWYPAVAPVPSFQIRFRPTGQFCARHVLYFDTETTGLSGGTGTRAFMIGAADWHSGQLRVRQLLCTSLAAEAAMLREFCQWLSPETVLVSYNGRSFDLPLLKSRLRLAKMADLLSGLSHIDLLYPTRRLYRGRWSNCRLGTIENHVLKLVREDDLPGSEAPKAWLSFLRAGLTTDLCRVIDHNTQDLRSLHSLLWHLVRIDEVAFELQN